MPCTVRTLTTLTMLAALSALAPAQIPYGHGNPGSSGVALRLGADQPWIGNVAHAYRIDRGRPLAPAAVLVSTARDETTLLGAPMWIGLQPSQFLFAVPLALDGAGEGAVAAPLPVSAGGLIGVRLHLQACALDVQGGAAFLAASNGLYVEYGDTPLLCTGADTGLPVGDQIRLIDPRTLAVLGQGTQANSEGMTGAVFVDGGRRLYLASSIHNAITTADLATSPPTWSTFANLSAPALGLAYDRVRQRLYTVSGSTFQQKDLVVFDADPASASYGNELARATAVTTLETARWWALAEHGDRAALYSASTSDELLLIDTDPASATYLQVVDNTVIPDLQPFFNMVNRVRIAADGSSAFVLLGVGFFTASSGLQRYDLRAGQWIDHNPGLAGIQAIGYGGVSGAPQVTSSDFALSRDESFGVLSDYDAIWRIDLDRDDPASWSLTRIPGTWAPNTSFGHLVTAAGHVLLLAPTVLFSTSDALLVDPFTGQVLASQLLPGVPWRSAFAER